MARMSLPVATRPTAEISILELSNERSVVNLVPDVVSQAIQDHAFTNPELFGIDERDLYKILRDDGKTPSPTDNRLRLKFWDEYERAQAQGLKQMGIVPILAGICSRELFYNNYLKRKEKVAWLLCPPTGYMIKAEEALEFGIEQLRDLLEQPHFRHGKIDVRLGNLKLKIIEMLDARVRGAVVQKSMNVNVNSSSEAVAKAVVASTSEDLMKQLKELDRKNRRAQNLPEMQPHGNEIEVESDIE